MVVGVPGTGIGGLFYLLMAASMPFVEAWRFISRGEVNPARWRFIAGQVALMGAIVGAMTLQAVAAREVFTWWAARTSSHALAANLQQLVKQQTGATAGFATFASVTMLAAVMLAVHFLRVTVGRRARIVLIAR